MPPLELISLGNGASVLQSRLWATNSVVVRDGGGYLVCDPSIFPEEIAQIRRETEAADRVHLVVTHSDYDHVCGIPGFPDAVVVAGARTAEAIADGTARAHLEEGGREWGIDASGPLRVDIVAETGDGAVGPFEVTVIDAPGHAPDGSAFLVREPGLLLTGDYLSAVTYPYLLGSPADAIATHERLLANLSDADVRLVVPGHGPPLRPAEAIRIAEQDLGYLRRLHEIAAEAVLTGASAGEAVVAAFSVTPPRRSRPDLEAFGLRSGNARRVVAECRARTPA